MIKVKFLSKSKLTLNIFWLSVSQFSCSVVSNSLRPHGLQHTRPPCPTPRVYSNSCPLSQWCHPTISSSVICFSSHLQSSAELRSFQMSQFFASGGQSIGVSASASVLPMDIQDWHLGCFYVLVIVNNATMSRGVQIIFSSYCFHSLDIYPEIGLLDHMVILFLF